MFKKYSRQSVIALVWVSIMVIAGCHSGSYKSETSSETDTSLYFECIIPDKQNTIIKTAAQGKNS